MRSSNLPSPYLRSIRSLVLAGCAICAADRDVKAEEQDLWERDKLTGTWGGARSALEDKGVDIGITYTGESLGVLSGGLQRGFAYEGQLDVTVDADLEALAGWTGGKAHLQVFQIHDSGRNAAELTGSLADPSNIDGRSSTRLFTAWLEQDLDGVASLRGGQLAADDEFLISTTAAGLINGTFGWPTIMSSNLPSGGPAYPLGTPGVRLQVNPSDTVSLLAGVFSGDPAGNCEGDPQACDKNGATFSRSGGAFWIGEAQYQVNQGKDAQGLAAAYKLGAWYHNADFADEHVGIDASGAIVSLAATPTPSPLNHRGNWGVYGIIDHMLWREHAQSASVFLRAAAAPADRNLVAWYVDGGIGFNGLIASRPNDTLTLGIAHSRISGDAAALDRDTAAMGGASYPIRSAETVFELSYIAQLAPWLTVQPDIQYIVRPGGNSPDPSNPTVAIDDAFLIGARVTIDF